MTITHLHRPAVQPVPHGLAEALAVIAHLHELTDTLGDDVTELRKPWRLLIGPVPNADEVFEHLHDELLALWSLTSDDWSEDDLDEVSEDDWRRYDFPTQQQEIDHRLGATIERLSSDVEGYIVRKRYELAELERAVTTKLAANRGAGMNVRELIDLLSDDIDPETVVAIYDGTNYRHIEKPMVEEFTLSFLLGSAIAEEDLA